jgi:hypothetical protein
MNDERERDQQLVLGGARFSQVVVCLHGPCWHLCVLRVFQQEVWRLWHPSVWDDHLHRKESSFPRHWSLQRDCHRLSSSRYLPSGCSEGPTLLCQIYEKHLGRTPMRFFPRVKKNRPVWLVHLIFSLVHLITQWIFSYFSFPLCVIDHTNQFSFTLYTNTSFLLSTWVFPFESCHQSRQSISLSLIKEWRKETITSLTPLRPSVGGLILFDSGGAASGSKCSSYCWSLL